MENRGFWEVLERIRELYTNRYGHSYICVVFRELYSEENIEMIPFKKLDKIIFRDF